MSADFDVLGVGTVAVDELITLAEYPREDEKVRVLGRTLRCGGLTGTALIAAARLGARCAYAGALGDDDDSRFVRTTLAARGVDLSAVVDDAAARPHSGTVLLVRETGTRTILSQPGHPGISAPPCLPIARVVLVDHHTTESALGAVRQLRRAADAQVVADLERETPQAASIEDLADHLIVPLSYARERCATADPATAVLALWRPWRRLAAVTDGGRGIWFTSDGVVSRQAAFAVCARDTTGCGDVFHGAYACLLARGLALAECIRGAAAAAALKAASEDGEPPTDDELRGFLEAHAQSSAR